MKLLSIIVPMYNSEKTIKKCMDSVININNIEIILIDDGSSDKTKEICLLYQEKYKNIKYIYQSNSGPGKARNNGIKEAEGKYVMFLDSDDYIETSGLEEILNDYLVDEKYDIVYYNFQQVSENGYIYKRYELYKFNELKKEDLIKNTISWTLPWGQFKIIKRKIILDNNVFFEEDIKNSEELFFTINVLNKSEKIYFFNKIVYNYLKRDKSISRDIDLEDYKNNVEIVFNKLYRKFENTEYIQEVYNYYVVSNIHILKEEIAKEKYTMFKDTSKEIRKNIKKMNLKYIAKRYKIILKILEFHLDYLLYIIFKVYFRRK